MKCVDHDFDSDFLQVFEGLDLVGFFLHPDDKIVFLIIENGPSIGDERIFKLFIPLLIEGKIVHPLLGSFKDRGLHDVWNVIGDRLDDKWMFMIQREIVVC